MRSGRSSPRSRSRFAPSVSRRRSCCSSASTAGPTAKAAGSCSAASRCASPAAACPPAFAQQRRQAATHVSCFQGIAGDSAFSLGMVADFARTLEEDGAWVYRRLFWETGLIGQVLYLEAEAAGVRSTGMGCYFDDLVHRLLDINPVEDSWQSLYHFTVGGAV